MREYIEGVNLLNTDNEKVSLNDLLKTPTLMFGGIPVHWNNNLNALDSIVMVAKNFKEIDGFLRCDLHIVSDRMNYILELEKEIIEQLFIDDGCGVSFIPNFTDGLLTSFSLDNKYTNTSKLRQDLVDENDTIKTITKGDKRLSLDINFKLPKGFNGDLNDAILELYKYRTNKKTHTDIFEPNPSDDVYTNWWNMVNESDRPFLGNVSLSEFDGENFNDLPIT